MTICQKVYKYIYVTKKLTKYIQNKIIIHDSKPYTIIHIKQI